MHRVTRSIIRSSRLAIAEPLEPVDSAAQATVSKARRSSFYLAMRVLPQVQREAMYEIYSFCREVDDIADGDVDPNADRQSRRAQLNDWRARIDALYPDTPRNAPADTPTADVLPKLAAVIAQFSLYKEDFVAVIDGMQMDLDADIQAPDFETLELYCDRVASAVGRLSTQVFGLPRESGVELARHLGLALQFTNILRDIDEDADIARLYLPLEALVAAGIESREPHEVLASPALPKACAWLALAARNHYLQADRVMRDAPRALVRAPRLMGVVYREIFEKTIRRGWDAPRLRVKVPRAKLIWLVLRYGFF